MPDAKRTSPIVLRNSALAFLLHFDLIDFAMIVISSYLGFNEYYDGKHRPERLVYCDRESGE